MSKTQPINKLKGFRDILPEDGAYWSHVLNVVETSAMSSGLERIDVPIVERADLFMRSVGEETDIVGKEMYAFDSSKIGSKSSGKDKEDAKLIALRPELTAGMVRAYIENGMQSLPKPVSLYSIGKCFRHENPQAGRYREFTQFGIEVFGETDPAIDANIITTAWQIFQNLKINNIEVNVNSMGCQTCRPRIKKLIGDFFKKKEKKLCEDCKKRLKKNPFRILDCKEEKCQSVISDAPLAIDTICEECKTHFMSVLEYLDEMNIPYNLTPTLVRGLDYYNRTVFEMIMKGDTKRQNAFGGGGRYDYLVEELGGDPTPAIGFALGLDRIVDYIRDEGIRIPKQKSKVDVYAIHLGDESKPLVLQAVKDIRKLDVSVGLAMGKDTMRAQLKAADKVNSLFSIIIGQREAVSKSALIRDMRDGIQETVELSELPEKIYKMVEDRKEEEKEYGKKVKTKMAK